MTTRVSSSRRRLFGFILFVFLVQQCQWCRADMDDEIHGNVMKVAATSGQEPTSSGENTKLSPDATRIKQQETVYRVKVGDTVNLPCVVIKKRNAAVIWQYSKNKIPETLTIGIIYYRKDYRIRLLANTSNEDEQSWNLEIRKVKLEDEGFYLCKVMATPESLKRVIYLQVEVDLRLHVASPHHNHNVNLETNLVLVCNTSYAIKESLLASSVNSSLLSAYRIMWYKDNELIQSHHHHQHHHHHDNAEAHLQTATSNSREVDASNNKVVHVISNNSVLNYKIEYFTRPVLWSKLVIKSLKPANLGTYTCVFRNQSASLLVNLENGFNKRLLHMENGGVYNSARQSVVLLYLFLNAAFLSTF